MFWLHLKIENQLPFLPLLYPEYSHVDQNNGLAKPLLLFAAQKIEHGTAAQDDETRMQSTCYFLGPRYVAFQKQD